ncbi:retrovirus-related pol polyprotein from transposon TNT 1-94 [Tanacetum coccineum]
MNESLKPTKTSTNLESLKDYEAEPFTPLPPQKTLQEASPSSEVESLTNQPHSPKERPGLVRMTKVIEGEFEKIKDVKVEDVSLTCDTSLEVFNNEVNRLSGMDDDLFTYEVEVANIPCDSKMDDDSEHEADDDMGYDPSDAAFTEWLGSKGDDEVELTDEESSDDMDEVAEVFRIDTNLFNFETPMCKAFKEFNYLLQIDPGLLNKDFEGLKTYEDCKDDWIYEWNKDDYEWYEALEDSELKDEALRNKAIMEGFIKEDDDEEELCEVHELPMCNIKRYMMIKYSFNNDEKYIAVKEEKYDDLTITREEACQAYQEVFRIIDEGWMVTRADCLVGVVLLVKDCRMINWRYDVSVPALTKDHKGMKLNTPYPEDVNTPYQIYIPTEVKNTEQESKLNELTKLVQMLMDEKINTKTNEQKPESSNSGSSSKILYCMICKREDHRTSDNEMYTASLKRSENYKARSYQYASPSKQILKAKAKPFPPCIHCGFNDHRPNDCRNYPECSSESSIGVKSNTCGSTVHSTSNHNEFEHFKRGEEIQASKAREPKKVGSQKKLTQSLLFVQRHIREPIWYLHSGFSSSMTGVKSYLHKYVEQPGPKVVLQDNSSCITEGYGSINCEDKPCSACEKGKHKRASFKTKQNFLIRKCLHLLHMDLFGPVSPVSIIHKKYTLVIVNEYSRTDNGTVFRNIELESFCDEKGISQNFSSPYTPKQNGVVGRKNRTLIEAARTMLNGSVLSKHFGTEAVRIACYTQNKSIIVKRHDKTPYEIFRERIPDISYFYVFGCLVFIHNHKDNLGKFDAKADDGYFLGYLFNSTAFRVFNTRRQQIEETYHVTFDETDPSRQYQIDSDISYYIIPHGRSLTELTLEKHVLEVIAPNEQDNPQTEDVEGTD